MSIGLTHSPHRTIQSSNMNLNESHVEDAALEWFEKLGYTIGHGPLLAPGEPNDRSSRCYH